MLITIALQTEFTSDERKLIARTFAAIPKDLYSKINPFVDMK